MNGNLTLEILQSVRKQVYEHLEETVIQKAKFLLSIWEIFYMDIDGHDFKYAIAIDKKTKEPFRVVKSKTIERAQEDLIRLLEEILSRQHQPDQKVNNS